MTAECLCDVLYLSEVTLPYPVGDGYQVGGPPSHRLRSDVCDVDSGSPVGGERLAEVLHHARSKGVRYPA